MNSKSIDTVIMRRATYFSVAAALSIVVIKLFAFVKTDSLAMLSSVVDSSLDVFSSTVNMLALTYALLPADKEHRFGHGKAEDIATLAQGAVIGVSGLFVIIKAVQRMIHPVDIINQDLGLIVMVIATFITFCLVSYQRSVVKKTGSALVAADSYHYATDIVSNLAVIASLVFTAYFKWQWIDSVFGFLLGLYIIFGACQIGYKAFHNLMDHEMDNAERGKIRDIALNHPGIMGMHDLRTRVSGINRFIQLHVELDGGMTLNEAHEITDKLEDKILAEFPNSEVLIHQDPVGENRKKKKSV